MPQQYYTAQQARELLGMTHSALLNQVTAGNLKRVIPPGRRQGVYLKEEVDKLKRELDAFFASRQEDEVAPAQFVKAMAKDIPGAVDLAHVTFGGHNTIPVERRVAWIQKNPDIDYLLKQEGEFVGFLTLVPMSPETIDDLLTLKRYAKDLTADDILPYEPGVPVDLYAMAIGTRPGVSLAQKRKWGMALLLGARSMLRDLGSRGIVIRTIQAHSYKPDGIRMMRHMGFTETKPKAPGLRDFIIRVQESGIPFLGEYREALAAWQANEQIKRPKNAGNRKRMPAS